MANLRETDVSYGDKTDHVFIRRPRYTAAMRLFGLLKVGMKNDEEFLPANVPPENLAAYHINLISEAIVDADGKRLYTPQQVDEWFEDEGGMEKIKAYAAAIDIKPAQAAGN